MSDTATLDLFACAPVSFDRANHRTLQRESDRARHCWRSTDAGHNRVCHCLCAACRYEREATGTTALPGRAA